MYRAVIFDLGKVLVAFDFKRGYRALEGLCPYPAAEIPKRLASTGLVERFETGLVEPQDFVARLSEVLDLRIDYQQFCSIWSCIFTETLIPPEAARGTRVTLSPGAPLQHQRHPLRIHSTRLRTSAKPFPRTGFVLRSEGHEAASRHLPEGHPGGPMPPRRMFLYRRHRGLRGRRARHGNRRRPVRIGRADRAGTGAPAGHSMETKKSRTHRRARWRRPEIRLGGCGFQGGGTCFTPANRRVPSTPLPNPLRDSGPAAEAKPGRPHSVWPNGNSPARK